jgi:hypothetical protein
MLANSIGESEFEKRPFGKQLPKMRQGDSGGKTRRSRDRIQVIR